MAELRLHLGAARTTVTARRALGGVAAVVGAYAVTALAHTAPVLGSTVLLCTIATITWSVLGDRPAVVCAVAIDVFRYDRGNDGLLGVAPWMIPLYFAFGVVAVLLGEIAAKQT